MTSNNIRNSFLNGYDSYKTVYIIIHGAKVFFKHLSIFWQTLTYVCIFLSQ